MNHVGVSAGEGFRWGKPILLLGICGLLIKCGEMGKGNYVPDSESAFK